MTPEDIQIKVRQLVAKKSDVPIEKISPQTRLAEDLGIDSFGAVELMFELEELFGLKIPDSEIEHVRTIQDIVDYLNGWLSKKSI